MKVNLQKRESVIDAEERTVWAHEAQDAEPRKVAL